jgi:hypothetical protein
MGTLECLNLNRPAYLKLPIDGVHDRLRIHLCDSKLGAFVQNYV